MPDAKMLRAALDAVDVGMALVRADRSIAYANAAFADIVELSAAELEGAPLFGPACPCEALSDYAEAWETHDLITTTGSSPSGAVVDVAVRPVVPGEDTRLVIVRRGLVRSVGGKRLSDEEVADVQEFVTELTGHPADAGTLGTPPISLLLVGIEDLEALKRSGGDETVEETLRQVAQALVLQKRKADIISRYGDDQFLVIAPDTPRAGASMLAERIRGRLELLGLDVVGKPLELATYVAEFRPHLDGSIRSAVERASEALNGRTSEPDPDRTTVLTVPK